MIKLSKERQVSLISYQIYNLWKIWTQTSLIHYYYIMIFQEISHCFNRAIKFSFAIKKFIFMCPVLLICWLIALFFRAIFLSVNSWAGIGMIFMPIFICNGILLSSGILLIRIYYHDVKGVSFNIFKLFKNSLTVIFSASQLSMPFVFVFLFTWIAIGVFYLIKSIGVIGESISVILIFCPFVLIFISLVLSICSFLILFFATPHIALKNLTNKNCVNFNLLKKITENLYKNIFLNMILLFISLIPLAFCILFLVLSIFITFTNYTSLNSPIASTMKWFFIMIPSTFIITPFIIFFFNFACESYYILNKKNREGAYCEVNMV